MTLTTTSSKQTYTGDGSTVTFPIPFKFFQNSDLVVTITDLSGNVTTKTLTTDYSVTGAGNASGGTLTMVVAPTLNYTLTIKRVVPLTQATSIRNQGAFFANIHEDEFDRLVMADQQLQQQITDNFAVVLAGPVQSFNGRTGIVLPASGDYTASQITGLAAFIAANGVSGFNGRIGAVAPAANDYSFAQISGKAGLAQGGTNADLSATGGTSQFLKQSTVGGAVTVGQPTVSDVSITQPFTGAVAQNLNSKSGNYVDLTDFMTSSQLADVAAKTGAVDMSSAFTAAISYIAGLTADSHTSFGAGYSNNRPTLRLPAVTLKVTQGFNITFRGFRMVGQGKGNTAIYYNTNSPIVLFDFGTFSSTPANLFLGTAQQWCFEDMTLIHDNGETAGARTCSAIRDNGCGNGYLKNVLFAGWQYGLNAVYGSDFTTTDQCDFNYCDYGAYWGPGCQQCDMNDSQFYFCYVGVMFEYGQEINMRRPIFAGPQRAAIYVYNQASGTTQLTSFPGQAGWTPALNSSIIAPHFESNNGGAGVNSIPQYFVEFNSTVAWTTLWFRDVDIVAGTDGTHYVNALIGNTGSTGAQYIWVENVQFIGSFAVGGVTPGYMIVNSGGNTTFKNWHTPAGYTTPQLANTSTSSTLYYDEILRTRKVVNGGLPYTDRITDDATTTGIEHVYNASGIYSMGFYNAGWIIRYGIDIQNRRQYFGDPTTPTSSWSQDIGTAIPASGSYLNGSFRWNSGAPNTGGWLLLGWSRLTTGSANVSGTDWAPTYVAQQVLGGAVASAATITPTGPVFHVTGTTAINTINLPYTGFIGTIRIIPDGLFTTGTSGNIALASTAVVSKVLEMTYDGTKWYPSY